MAHRDANPSPLSSVSHIKRHPRYYLNGGDVYFLVEDYTYRVHRYFFERESAWFRELLGAPTPADQVPRGSSEAHPFPLHRVTASSFSKFLWVFYNPKYSMCEASLEDWIDILTLAYDWRFDEVKQLCTREIERFPIQPVDKIELYQKYELDQGFLIPSFLSLSVRAEPLSLPEGRQLGLATALLIAKAREYARSEPALDGKRSPMAAEIEEGEMVSIIKQVFELTAGPPSSIPPERSNGVSAIPITSPRKK